MKKSYKLIIFLIFIFVLPQSLFSQGWVAKSGNTLVAYDNNLGVTNVQVGIGTATPAAQFHVANSVRFSGLSNNNAVIRILGTNVNGDIYYKDLSTFGATNAWLLTGNSSTIPSTNFLRTLDAQPIVFRTNNIERMKLLVDGSYRLRPNDNCNILIRNSPNVAGENDNIGIDFIRNDASDNSTSNIKARIQFDGYPLTYSDPTLLHAGYIRFFTNDSLNNFKQRLVINPAGNVGIGSIYSYPSSGYPVTRPFEVDCNNNPIKLRNLPSGSGSYLVIDINGDVRKTTTAPGFKVSESSQEIMDLKEQIESLKSDIENLKAQMSKFENSYSSGIDKNNFGLQYSLDIRPNPANSLVEISSYLPKGNSNGVIKISDINCRILKQFNSINSGFNSSTFNVQNISNGTYFCYLIVDNKVLMNKRFVILK